MSQTLLWLVASLAFASLASLADGAPLQVMSAPNLLRVGTAENIFVECQDCTGGNINVEIRVMNHPTKTARLASTSVTLTSANNFQELAQITIPVGDFSRDPKVKQYVYLQAQFPDRLLEKVVLVSFQSGFIFIQTDKTLYTPNSRVFFRMFAVTPRMEPVERDQGTDLDIEIVTPEGIILPLDSVSLRSGVHSGIYHLAETASPGLWKVVAKFRSSPQQSYSAEFEVKEYVLPSFEVKLTSASPFFYVDGQELTVNIRATYLFGEEVDGTAYVVFGVIQDGQKKSFPSSIQRVPIKSSNGVVRLRREHITQTFQNIHDLVGSSIFVAVSVLTESGGEMVEAELRGIKIVTSPYTIHLKRTPKHFKPGMSFNIVVEVVNPDDTPAQGVAVVVDPGQQTGVTAANGLASITVNIAENTNRLTISAKTNDPRLPHGRQASTTMTALPYTTKSNNYIQINVDTVEVRLGNILKMQFFLNRQRNEPSDITYLILSRGQLVKYGRYRTRGQIMITMAVPITKDMLPSFRVIAYYHTNDNEVVSDSVWVDVEDSCMGSLKLEPTRAVVSYEPRKMFGLKVTGDPEATVGLVAVDKGVYILNNKHRLTQKKVWDIVDKSDTGCTPGGGRDGMSVFYDAGLLFESSAGGTPYRQDLRCPAPSRRKRSEEDDSYMDDILSRTRFPESWLWSDIKLPACPPQLLNCDTTSSVKNVPLSDSITTWQFIGISLSRTHGICVADPLEVIVRKEFFIDLKLPYSAVRGEQLEIKAILHNYSPDPITVRVDLIATEHVCSPASNRGRYRQEVNVGPQTTRSVPFVISPLKEGQLPIEVKASVRDSFLSDGVRKMLQVVPEGILVKSPVVITLDPAKKGAAGLQEETINSKIPLKDLAPNTPTATLISVTGKEQMSGQDFDLNVKILLPGRTRPSIFHFNKENYHFTRTEKFSSINEDVKVAASGNGEATLTMVSFYYALPREKDSDCQKFNISVELVPVRMDEDETIYKLKIEVLYKDRDRDATMTVLDIGLLTGFTVNTRDLDLLSRGRARTISKYEMNTVLSERGSLIIYLDKVSHTQPEEIAFRIHQKLKVGILQPAAVSVYEYYDPTPCVKFYHPERRNGYLMKICRNNTCTCAEDSCSMQKRGNIPNDERIASSCGSLPTNRKDFVYKVRVESFEDALSTDIYTVRILEVIKEAPDDMGSQGKLRTFISHQDCRAALNLSAGKNYLIMGSSKEIYKDESSYQYMLTERTWIEYWPTDAECLTAEYRQRCLGLEELVQQHMLFGCGDC